MQKKQNKKTWWDGFKSILLSPQFRGLIEKGLVAFLGKFISVKGWLIGLLIREFSEEVTKVIKDTGDYIISRKELDDANNNEDRDSSARDINDWMRES